MSLPTKTEDYREGYLFCGDILGFKEMCSNLEHSVLSSKIKELICLIDKSAKENQIINYKLISDTILAFCKKDELHNLVKFCRLLLNEGIALSLPIRGAITYGKFTWSDIVYGEAVIKAYALEKKQDWVGIIIDNNCGITTESYSSMDLVSYSVPMRKNDSIEIYPVICWNVPSFEELANYLSKDGLGGKPSIGKKLNWDWGNKIGNTILFGVYIYALTCESKSKDLFYGNHPVHFIDCTLRKDLQKS